MNAVWSELVSAGQFPAKQVNNREFRRFQPPQDPPKAEKATVHLRFLDKFPIQRNREF